MTVIQLRKLASSLVTPYLHGTFHQSIQAAEPTIPQNPGFVGRTISSRGIVVPERSMACAGTIAFLLGYASQLFRTQRLGTSLAKQLSVLLVLCSIAPHELSAAELQFLPDVFGYGPVFAQDGKTIYDTTLDDDDDGFRTLLRWSAANGLSEFELPLNSIKDVSANGTVVGSSTRGDEFQRWVYRWTEDAGIESLSEPPQELRVSAVSADGSVTVGWDGSVVVWNETTTPTDLGGLAGYDFTRAHDTSDDGSVIVGEARRSTEAGTERVGWIWNAEDGFVAADAFSQINFVSGDGSVFVGKGLNGQYVRWTEEGGAKELGNVPGTEGSGPAGVSRDGVIVGEYSYLDDGSMFPSRHGGSFVWDEQHGIRDLESVLRAEHGLRIPAFAAFVTVGISDDLQSLAGWWEDPLQFTTKSWFIQLDRPLVDTCDDNSMGDLDGNGKVEFADFLALSANFGQSATGHETGDIDCNGTVEFDDFLILSANFGQTIEAVSVPEPTGEPLVILGFVSSFLGTKRRRRSTRTSTYPSTKPLIF